MKRLLTLSLSALLLVSATGCEDARAKLQSSNDVVFTVGNQSFTKGQIYSILSSTNGANVAIDEAIKTICNVEIETTDEMKQNAQSILDNYKTMYGDSFLSSLKSSGMSEEDYVENMIFSEKETQLIEKYINENYSRIADTYMPVQATVLTFSRKTKQMVH